ncbi:MAG: hypothetical protein SFW08_07640 [Gemmatimonadaceae bacterium]|nr:hypothetical protein [Gemmatimonadaceae bacterium]
MMRKLWHVGLLLTCAASTAIAQDAEKKPKKEKTPGDSAAVDTTPRKLFRDKSELLQITITSDLKKFVRMRERGRPPIPAKLDWKVGSDTAVGTLPIQIGTRGNFRLRDRNCSFPPVRLILNEDVAKKTLWAGQKRLKLVTRCNEGKDYEQYILQEYALYEIYNLLTPMSFRARLARVAYRDQLGKEKPIDTYAFLIEDDGDMAKRLGGKITDAQNAVFDDVDGETMDLVGAFEFLIGNTDWSVGGLHNIKLVLRRDAIVFPVAYDFDHSGAVNARYATTDPKLRIRAVRDRLYRGKCMTPEQEAAMVARFNEKKAAIYAVYDRIPDLDPKIVKDTREYFDEFYETLNDARLRKRRMLDECQAIGN